MAKHSKGVPIVITIRSEPEGFLAPDEIENFCKAAREDVEESGHNWKFPHYEKHKLIRQDSKKVSRATVIVIWEIEN